MSVGSSLAFRPLAAPADAQFQAKIDIIPCPVEPLKGIKNPVEQQGYRNAYLRDGRAMVHQALSLHSHAHARRSGGCRGWSRPSLWANARSGNGPQLRL